MVKLRDYQEDCIQTIINHFKKHSRQIIQLPTGSGKTFIFLSYLSRFSNKSLIICPSIELVEQVKESSLNFMHDSEMFAKINNPLKPSKHTVLTTASLNYETTYEFLLEQEFDTIVIDEAHKSYCDTYINFLNRYIQKHPNFKLIGFTATPERADNKSLLDIFGTLTFDMNFFDLISKGELCDVSATRFESGQSIQTSLNSQGDFRLLELKKLKNEIRDQIIKKIVLENYNNKPSIIFCIDIEHANTLADMLISSGVKCASIHGKMSYNERRRIISDFKSGRLKVLTNCQILTEGFDAPLIENIIITRPTRSKALYCQMIGRGVRKSPGKTICNLFELTDNNHKICTFNILAGKDIDCILEYEPKTTLTKRIKDFEDIDLSSVVTNKKSISLKKSEVIDHLEVLTHQTQYLKENNIQYVAPLSFKEAAFLIWKDRLGKSYGYN